jgi:hypothetical protein
VNLDGQSLASNICKWDTKISDQWIRKKMVQ